LSLLFFSRAHLAIDLHASLIKPGLTALSAIVIFYALHTICPKLALLLALVTQAVGCYFFACLTPQDMVGFSHFFRLVARKFSSVK